MDLGTDMMRDEANDAFAVSGRQLLACVAQPFREPVDPQPPVRVQHHLDDGGVFQMPGDGRTQRRAQHPRAAGKTLMLMCCHANPDVPGS